MNAIRFIGIVCFAASLPIAGVSCIDRPASPVARSEGEIRSNSTPISLDKTTDGDAPLAQTLRTGNAGAVRELNHRVGW